MAAFPMALGTSPIMKHERECISVPQYRTWAVVGVRVGSGAIIRIGVGERICVCARREYVGILQQNHPLFVASTSPAEIFRMSQLDPACPPSDSDSIKMVRGLRRHRHSSGETGRTCSNDRYFVTS